MLKKFVLFFVLIGLFSCKNVDNQQNIIKVESFIEKIRRQLSPDKRDLIFRYKVVNKHGELILKGVTDLPVLKEKVLIFLQNKGYDVIDSLRLLPEKKYNKVFGITRLSVANLRAVSKHASELVTQTLMGMPLHIFEEQNGFYHVQTPEGYYAWIDAAGLVIMDSIQVSNWLKLPKVIITKHYGKVYQSPDVKAFTVSDFVLSDVFGLIKIQGDYAQVVYPDGRQGYIKNDTYVSLKEFKENNKNTGGDSLINYAKQYLGIPYLWGGTSIKGLDCSGFTKNVYAQIGYNLPRDASQQVKFGLVINITSDFSNLQPGDLLFFGHKNNGIEKITHVAMHIGNGRIIHATGEVKIESLNKNDADFNPDRYKTLLQARRLIGYIDRNFVQYYTSEYLKLDNQN